jgi:curved DNA-binding protein CbpA
VVASLYDFLGVSPDADADAIHHAYRAAARRLHPDTAESGAAGDDEAMRALNEAWAVLRDPARRAAYDATLDWADWPHEPSRRPPGWMRRAPVVAVLAVLLAIFIITAYAAVPTGGR